METPVKVTGGNIPYPTPYNGYCDRSTIYEQTIGLDVTTSTVIVESGIILSDLESILESVALSIDSFGRIPNLTVVDAISIGAFGGNASLLSSIASIEVILSNGKIMSWNWERNPVEMKTVCCGLGMAGVIISATFKCIPIQKFTEVSYLCSIRDVMEQWSMQFKSSFCQQLTWFPFSELMVMTHLNPSDPYSNESSQPWLNFVLEKAFDYFSWFIRQIGIFASQYDAPVFNSVLSRIQFIAQWSIAKNRSDYSHSPIRFWSPNESCQWTAWLIPQDKLPHVLYNISAWANSHPNSDTICGISPLFIQSLKVDKNMIQKKPYLAPYLDRPAVTVWYDWFIPKIDPNPIAISEFEDIFHSVGAVRAWYGERLTSPLYALKLADLRDVCVELELVEGLEGKKKTEVAGIAQEYLIAYGSYSKTHDFSNIDQILGAIVVPRWASGWMNFGLTLHVWGKRWHKNKKTKGEKDDFQTLIRAMSEAFPHEESVLSERYRLSQMKQAQDEPIDDFVTRLRGQGKFGKFNSVSKKGLVFILTVIQLARSMETSSLNASEMEWKDGCPSIRVQEAKICHQKDLQEVDLHAQVSSS
ncbi:unnamed protein product [Lepeophtheirus salmonis]|uniref:(salmon louse) hypothetical protein n=1 Tax=Lepeophtheirus salmonis TaxID=72036 RepID=A0A7R8CLZ7_LEPSM|nr:unnamed protein product [Lepeophtheirus salmonis]CAF2827261.1 unnamed protein product [Lepeophtheirus salmonis]